MVDKVLAVWGGILEGAVKDPEGPLTALRPHQGQPGRADVRGPRDGGSRG